jgi:hypothetical protein
MKNQNDLIFSIVALVLGLIAAGVFYAMRPQPTPPAPPQTVNVQAAALPNIQPVYANGLAGAGQAAGSPFGAGGGGPSGDAGGGRPMATGLGDTSVAGR